VFLHDDRHEILTPTQPEHEVKSPDTRGETIYLAILIDTYDEAQRDLYWELLYVLHKTPSVIVFSERYFLLMVAFEAFCEVAT